MLMSKIGYQESAVAELVKKTIHIFENDNPGKTFLLQSCTGSGKTVMMAKFIEAIASATEMEGQSVAFFWISPGKGNLYVQSKNKVSAYLGGFPKCVLLEDEYNGIGYSIHSPEVVFVDWEKLNAQDKDGNWKNTLMKESATINLPEIMEHTREEGTKIIFIIDESHVSSISDRANDLRDNVIQPYLTIEMTATPLPGRKYDQVITVDKDDVKRSGMVKKEIVINFDLKKIAEEQSLDTLTMVMTAAEQKRQELKALLEKEPLEDDQGHFSSVNPLVLIQLPDEDQAGSHDKREFAERWLHDHGKTTDNGKLAIWLSGDDQNHLNLDGISENDNQVEYLIFKQAIATGWDCPRAYILVKFREVKSEIFNIQVLGRITRMPERRFYINEALNTSYVYSNLKSVEAQNDPDSPVIIKTEQAQSRFALSPVCLTSFYKSKNFNILYIRYGISKYIKRNMFGRGNLIDFNDREIKEEIMTDAKIAGTDVDEATGAKGSGTVSVQMSSIDLENQFNAMIKANLGGYNAGKSISNIKLAIYRAVEDTLDISSATIIQQFLMNPKNREQFQMILKDSVDEYKQEDANKKPTIEHFDKNWNIPLGQSYTKEGNTKLADRPLSVFQPLYLKNYGGRNVPDALENDFSIFLEQHADKIDWYWHNGDESSEKNFGIKIDDAHDAFRPDWIIGFKDGRIGIFDTKPIERDFADTKMKAEALQRYLKAENAERHDTKLIGGIVVDLYEGLRAQQEKAGAKHEALFKISQSDEYETKDVSSKSGAWKYFSDII
jgi:type III restriction enzyme